MNSNFKILVCLIVEMLVVGFNAQAQVAATATLPGTTLTSVAAPTYATSGTFDMNGGNAVALFFTCKYSTINGAIGATATFAGQPMTLGISTNYTSQWSGVFYLTDPVTTSGQFVITANGTNAISTGAYSAIALGNVGGVAGSNAVANANSSGSISLNYTTQTNGGFVLAACANNAYIYKTSVNPPPALFSGNANQTLFQNYVNNNGGFLHAYGAVPTAGSYTDVYTNLVARNAFVTMAFETAEQIPALTWIAGSEVWDIDTSSNWTDGVNLQAYKESLGVGSQVTFDDTASGPSPVDVTLNTTVTPSSMTVSNSVIDYNISGSGSIGGGFALVKKGSGTLTLGTANTFGGAVNLDGGTTEFSALNNLGSGNAINFDGGTLKYNGNSDDISTRVVTFNAGGATIDDGSGYITFNNVVGNNGSGGLTKAGSGTLVLGDGYTALAYNYHGNTVVANGTLYINAYATLPNTPAIIVNAGAIFDDSNNGLSLDGKIAAGDGTIAGPVTSSTGIITPGTNGAAGALTFANDLSISGGSLIIDVSTNVGQSDLLVVGGNLTISGGSLQLNVSGTLTNGTYKLIQYGSLSGSSGGFVLTGYSQPGKSLTISDTGSGEIDLVVADTASDNILWTGSAGATWDLTGSQNWQLSGGGSWTYTNGDAVAFDQSGISNPNVSIQTAVAPGSVLVSNDLGTTYAFVDGTSLGAGKLKGPTSIVKKGPGTLLVGTPNINTGGATIEAGTINVTGSLGSGSVTNNGQLVLLETANDTFASLSGTGGVTRNGTNVVTVAGKADYTGPTTITAGTLQLGSGGADGVLATTTITNDGTLILNSSTDWTFSIPDTGTGNLTKEGTNTLTLSGSNSRTGDTAVYHGKLVLGNANQLKGSATVTSGAVLDMNGHDQLLSNLNGPGGSPNGKVVNDAGMSTNILTVSNSVAGTASVDIYDNEGSGGTIAFVKEGAGMLSMYGKGYYSGGTTLEAGTVKVWGSIPFGPGPLFMTGGALDFYGNNAYVTNVTYLLAPTNTIYPDGNNYWPAPLIGTNDVLVDFSLNGNNDYLNINGGAGKWTGVTNTVYLRGTGGYLRFDSGVDASSVVFDLNDSGVTIGSTKAEDIHLGALIGNTNTALLWPSGGSSYTIGARNLSTTFAGQLAGSASSTSLIKVGTGTLTLTGTNLFTAALTVSNGILALAQDAAPSSMSAIRVVSGATLDVTGLASSTLSLGTTNVAQIITGSGTVNGGVLIGTNAIVSPGASIGTLTINNALTLNGIATMELNRTNNQKADRINAGYFSGTGVVNVTNIGPDLVTGDTFQLFSAAVPASVAVNLPASNVVNTVQYIWTNRVDQDGSIQLLSGANAINPNPPMMQVSVAGSILKLAWPTNAGWILQSNSVGLATGSAWFNYPANGSVDVTNVNITMDPAKTNVFFRMVKP